jgi:hypothetical protein
MIFKKKNYNIFRNPTLAKDSSITEIWKPYTASEKSYFVIDEVLENRQNPPRMNAISQLYQKFTGHF